MFLFYFQNNFTFNPNKIQLGAFSFFFSVIVTAQLPSYQATILKEFDNSVGIENTPLYSGVESLTEYRLANDEYHPYYVSSDFVVGSVFYNNAFFPEVNLKLNVYEDELLTKIKHELSRGVLILTKSKIDRFYILSKEFTFLAFAENGTEFEGYCEVLFESKNVMLLKKNNKKRYQIFREGSVFYEFKNVKSDYILKFLNRYYLIYKPNDFKTILPSFKDEFKLYFNKRLYKTNKDSHLISLASKMNNFYSKNKTIPIK
jgi:hypothetical protein